MLGAMVIACYLVGSIPVAWLVAKLITGCDLRRIGSGNVGVMNAAMSIAPWAGWVVFMTEAAKGILAVMLARSLFKDESVVGLAVLATFVGTRWSIWLGGAGGRGNTVAVVALLAASWPTFVSVLTLWVLARLVTRTSFTATRTCLLTWPYIFGLITQSLWLLLLGAFISLLFLSTHRKETDDHLLLTAKRRSVWEFLTAPHRKRPNA